MTITVSSRHLIPVIHANGAWVAPLLCQMLTVERLDLSLDGSVYWGSVYCGTVCLGGTTLVLNKMYAFSPAR